MKHKIFLLCKRLFIMLSVLLLLTGCKDKSDELNRDDESEQANIVSDTLSISAPVQGLWYLYNEEQGKFCLYDNSFFSQLSEYIEETLSKQVYRCELNEKGTMVELELTESQRLELYNKTSQAIVDTSDFLEDELDYFVNIDLGENDENTLEIKLEPESFMAMVSNLNKDNLMGFYNINMLIDLCYLNQSLESKGISSLEVRFINSTSGYCMMEYSKQADFQESASFSAEIIRRSNYQDYSDITSIPVTYQGNITLHFTGSDVQYASFLTLDDGYFSEGTLIYLPPEAVSDDLQAGCNAKITIETGLDVITIIGDESNPDGIGFDGDVLVE